MEYTYEDSVLCTDCFLENMIKVIVTIDFREINSNKKKYDTLTINAFFCPTCQKLKNTL
jgi:hypothetical protein